jgi:hypothetical protein
MGLGLVFFGMGVMSDAMAPLRSYQPFLDVMQTCRTRSSASWWRRLFTGLIQSSAATTGIVIVMASQGFVNLPTGIALAFGANIGTCATALLASIGKPREAVRAAVVHVLFNVAGVLVWVGLIGQLAEFVRWISPSTRTERHRATRRRGAAPDRQRPHPVQRRQHPAVHRLHRPVRAPRRMAGAGSAARAKRNWWCAPSTWTTSC